MVVSDMGVGTVFCTWFGNVVCFDNFDMSGTQTLPWFSEQWRIVICVVRYEGLSDRVWACHSDQLIPDTLLTDLSLHILDNTMRQYVPRCWNLGSHTVKRQRMEMYILFIAGNSCVMPYVCIVYTACPLSTCFSLVSMMFENYCMWTQ